MTAPKIVQNPPQGSGLVPSVVDQHYDDLTRGVPGEHVVAACILQPVGTSQRRTKEGWHRTVTYEIVRLEPMRDAHDADQVTWLVTRAHDLRHSGSQMTFPVANTPGEQRTNLLAAIDEWATGEGIDQDQLNAMWTEHFGGEQHAASTEVDKGSLANLLEFAGHKGAIDDPYATEKDKPADPPFSDDGDPADDDEPPSDDSTTEDDA